MFRMSTPFVSIIMPVYNDESYVSEAIESILSQSYTNFEFIIIDDGSNDNTKVTIRAYAKRDERIIFLENRENLGICETLNRAIQYAQGSYIVRMDSDDISEKHRIETQLWFLMDHPDIGIVGSSIRLIDTTWKTLSERHYHTDDAMIRRYLFRYSPFCHPAIMVRKEILDRAWYYDPLLIYAEDYDLYFRIGKCAKFANIPEILLRYRIHEQSTTAVRIETMERKTLAIRMKAVREYGYAMSIWDRIYFTLQYISRWIIPPKWKIRLFQFFRDTKRKANT